MHKKGGSDCAIPKRNNRLTDDAIVSNTSNDVLPVSFSKKEWGKMNKRFDECNDRIKELQNQVDNLKNIIERQNSGLNIIKPAPENAGKSKEYSNKNNNNIVNCTKKEAVIVRPQNDSEYKYLRVVDGGKLTLSPTKDNTYYRAWEDADVLYYEFSSLKESKAINNRTSIIEPFCDICRDSIEPDKATRVETKTMGILNNDLSINKKTLIIYK